MDLPGGLRHWMRTLGPLGKEAGVFAHALGDRRGASACLLVVGSPEFEPWHFTAHLQEAALSSRQPHLVPTLLRWKVPAGAPSHLAMSVDSLGQASRDQTVLVVHLGGPVPDLLERVTDARHRGARIMTLHRENADLIGLSHETLSIDASRPPRDFEITQHVVTALTPRAVRSTP